MDVVSTMTIKPKSIPTMIRKNLGCCMCSEALFKSNSYCMGKRGVLPFSLGEFLS